MSKYVIVTTDTRGAVDNLVGPFDTSEEAVKYMEENDAYFADLETDLVKDGPGLEAETVETSVLVMNEPHEVGMGDKWAWDIA